MCINKEYMSASTNVDRSLEKVGNTIKEGKNNFLDSVQAQIYYCFQCKPNMYMPIKKI